VKPEIPYEALEKGFFQSVTWQRGLLALATLVGFLLLAKLAGFLLRRLLGKYAHVGGSGHALSKLLTYFIVFIGVVTALSALGLPLSSVVLTSSALLIGIGFSLQHTTRDLVSGIVLLVEQRIRTGDFVTVADISGTVQDIGLRSTCVLTPDGETLVVPNQLLVTSELSNQSHPHRRARLNIEVPVAFDADADTVAEVLMDIAAGHAEVLRDPAPVVRFDAMAGTHFELTLIVWVTESVVVRRVASELRFAIARQFAQRGLPFPTPELRLLH
jgi:small-conductance mechanosensitive channel